MNFMNGGSSRRASTLTLALVVTGMLVAGCPGRGTQPTVVGPAPTAPTTTNAVAASTTVATAPPTTAPPTTATTAKPAQLDGVVDSGTSSSGSWRLVAEPGGRTGLVCATLVGPFQFGGRVCNAASEQDFNGDDILRYSTAGDGAFVIGVSRPNVANVRMELRAGPPVERATVAARFTTLARFVALPMPKDAVVRSLTAYDGGGNVLTTITINR